LIWQPLIYNHIFGEISQMHSNITSSIHNRGLCGHIEEVSVAKDHQGKRIGLKVIQALDSVAVSLGCYKTILDCSPENEPFYVKCGYHNSGVEMSHYYEEEKDSYHRG
jgi:glucosamine-phosphate N-acetyltransferase